MSSLKECVSTVELLSQLAFSRPFRYVLPGLPCSPCVLVGNRATFRLVNFWPVAESNRIRRYRRRSLSRRLFGSYLPPSTTASTTQQHRSWRLYNHRPWKMSTLAQLGSSLQIDNTNEILVIS